jgi:hypothetical protein
MSITIFFLGEEPSTSYDFNGYRSQVPERLSTLCQAAPLQGAGPRLFLLLQSTPPSRDRRGDDGWVLVRGSMVQLIGIELEVSIHGGTPIAGHGKSGLCKFKWMMTGGYPHFRKPPIGFIVLFQYDLIFPIRSILSSWWFQTFFIFHNI